MDTIADNLSKFPINAGLAKAEEPILVSSQPSSEENDAAQQLVSRQYKTCKDKVVTNIMHIMLVTEIKLLTLSHLQAVSINM